LAYPYIVLADVEGRLSKATVQQIFDDDDNGDPDADPIATLCADSSSKVASYLRGNYDLEVVASVLPHEVVRLSLDVAVAYAAQRFPSYVRHDWEKLMKAAECDLQKLRDGKTRLDVVAEPEPSTVNVAAVVASSARRGW
jgi:phage gp36-like protein